jgi:hypothetical protein
LFFSLSPWQSVWPSTLLLPMDNRMNLRRRKSKNSNAPFEIPMYLILNPMILLRPTSAFRDQQPRSSSHLKTSWSKRLPLSQLMGSP